jgi:two-component sensor histidine kinase
MADDRHEPNPAERILATPDLAGAVKTESFKLFLDQMPIAIVIAELKDAEVIIYANPEFETVAGQSIESVLGRPWEALAGQTAPLAGAMPPVAASIDAAIVASKDFVGTFKVERGSPGASVIDVYSNVISDNDGTPSYRLAAFVDVGRHPDQRREDYEQRLREKDVLLFELQHRVKNNLQLIMALMRMEIRNAQGRETAASFERLAGRIEAVKVLYALLSEHQGEEEVDLGAYLSEIAAAVLRSHAVPGIRLNLQVDTYPVSVNVAMPAGLVVNELLTNALKHAFVGRSDGTIRLQSLADGEGCRVVIADDGVGLPPGVTWPEPGRLSALIVQSLRENARADIETHSEPGRGFQVKILFRRANAAPTPIN